MGVPSITGSSATGTMGELIPTITSNVTSVVRDFAEDAQSWGDSIAAVGLDVAKFDPYVERISAATPGTSFYSFDVSSTASYYAPNFNADDVPGVPQLNAVSGSLLDSHFPSVPPYNYEAYDTSILAPLATALANVIDDKVLLTPSEVWDSLWKRGLSLEKQVEADERYAARSYHASLGWDMPGSVQLVRERAAQRKAAERVNAITTEMVMQRHKQFREDWLTYIDKVMQVDKHLMEIFYSNRDRLRDLHKDVIEMTFSLQETLIKRFHDTTLLLYNTTLNAEDALKKTAIQKYTADIQALQVEVQKEQARVNSLISARQVAISESQLGLQAQVEEAKNKFGYWSTEWQASAQWRSAQAGAFAQLGASAYAAANISLGADSGIRYSYSRGYSQSLSRDYGVNVSVSSDSTNVDLDPAPIPNYI